MAQCLQAPLPAPIAPPSPGGMHSSLSSSIVSNSIGSRSSSGSRPGSPGGFGSTSPPPLTNGHDAPAPPSPLPFDSSNSLDLSQIAFPTSLPPAPQAAIPFHEVPTSEFLFAFIYKVFLQHKKSVAVYLYCATS